MQQVQHSCKRPEWQENRCSDKKESEYAKNTNE